MTKTMTVALLSVGLALPAQEPEAAESLLQAATKKEVVDGDLTAAIAGYRKALAAAKSNRGVAAKALYQLGECYRKQGDAQARQMFERLIKEYGDQPIAAEARVRLAAMAGAGKETRARLLWDDAPRLFYGVSADGRWVSFQDRTTSGLALRDLSSGVEQRLKKGVYKSEGLDSSIVSPDGSQVAFF
jgi:tetratricopeptide (TPR) repeat protein